MKRVAIALALWAFILPGVTPAQADDIPRAHLVSRPPLGIPLGTHFSRLAAEAQFGFSDAQVKLGEAYLTGFVVQKDHSKALTWFRIAAEQGNPDAYNHIAEIYYSGDTVARNEALAVDWIRRSANLGNHLGQRTLGELYWSGRIVSQDYIEAYKWTSLSVISKHYGDFDVDQTSAIAVKMTPGQIAEADQKIAAWRAQPKNPNQLTAELASDFSSPEALQTLTTLAESGNPLAQFGAARLYESGKAGPINSEGAAYWFQKAAKQGHAGAQAKLGMAYLYGDGVPQNEALGIDWLRKAADRGIRQAQFSMGEVYYNGYGVPVDFALAANWYRKAAEQASAQAQHKLAIGFLNGTGVDRDYVQSYKWMGLAIKYAAKSDLPDWKSEADKISALMTPDQIREAEKQISNWHPQIQMPE